MLLSPAESCHSSSSVFFLTQCVSLHGMTHVTGDSVPCADSALLSWLCGCLLSLPSQFIKDTFWIAFYTASGQRGHPKSPLPWGPPLSSPQLSVSVLGERALPVGVSSVHLAFRLSNLSPMDGLLLYHFHKVRTGAPSEGPIKSVSPALFPNILIFPKQVICSGRQLSMFTYEHIYCSES